MKRLDTSIRRTPDREVLRLRDMFSGHASDQCIPLLTYLKVVFLPPNSTSKLQPIDAGMISCMKKGILLYSTIGHCFLSMRE